MVDVPSRATPVWLVSSATLAPARRAKPSARSTSMPVRTGARGAASPARADGDRGARRRLRRTGGVGGGGRGLRGGGGDDRRQLRPQRHGVALALGVDAVGHHHHVGRRRRIDPHRRAGEAGVAERADREQLAAVRREARIEVPAEAADVGLRRRRRRRRHPGDRQRREDAPAVQRALAEQHAAEARQIVGGGEHPGVAGDAAHPPRRRIVHDAAQHRRGRCRGRAGHARLVRRAPLRRRDPRHQRRARPERGVAHAERREDAFLRVAIERQPADLLDDPAEQDEVDVAVDDALVDARHRHLVDGQRQRVLGAAPGIGQVDVGPEAGGVREQVADGDVALPVALEAGDVAGHRIDQPQPAFFDQLHHAGRRRDDLGQRGRVEDRVERHRLARRQRGPRPDRLPDEDAIAVPDDDHRARQLLRGDRVVDQRMDARRQRRLGAGLGDGRGRVRGGCPPPPRPGRRRARGPASARIIRARGRGRRSSRSGGSGT